MCQTLVSIHRHKATVEGFTGSWESLTGQQIIRKLHGRGRELFRVIEERRG